LTAALRPTSSGTPVPLPGDEHLLGEIRMRPDDGAVMVYVLSGKFIMGSNSSAMAAARKLCREYTGETAIAVCTQAAFTNEYPAHPVTLTGFWIDRTEVTNGQYRRCEDSGACTQPVESGSYYRSSYYSDPAYANYPVIWVTQGQAANYCAWAGGRLPTEAEWEYAARGPESTIFPWGNEFDGARLNYCDKNCDAGPNDPSVDDGYADTAPVGSYPAGASWAGALDMAGNVREWVADWYGVYLPGLQADPVGPETGEGHIPRGGAWLDKPDDVRSANRGENSIDYTRHKVGFRCALSASVFARP
jgi:formylglycine-generating enzyme required for sulfatase activity